VRHTHVDSIRIDADPAAVWRALVDPDAGRRWRGADFTSDWRTGSPLRITGQIGPKRLNDRGIVREAVEPERLSYSFLPRVSGLLDLPENQSIVEMLLAPHPDGGTLLTLSHSVPPSPVRRGKGWEIGPESGIRHVAFYWRSTLPLLRDLVEGRPHPMLALHQSL
jgi:uncharacterized protein YndB with AHSA1/START domain